MFYLIYCLYLIIDVVGFIKNYSNLTNSVAEEMKVEQKKFILKQFREKVKRITCFIVGRYITVLTTTKHFGEFLR